MENSNVIIVRMELHETRGRRVQRFRQEAGLSQGKLSRLAGVPAGTLRNIEQDHRPYPRVDTAILIARALQKPVEELFLVAERPQAKT